MSTTKNKIFQFTEHLTDEQLRRYVDDVSNATEKHLVERHCADCEMCNDALDGLLMLKEQGNLASAINTINKSVHEKLQLKTKVLFLDTRVRIAIAAAVALLVVSVFFFNNQLQENSVTVSDNITKTEENTSHENQKDLLKQDITTGDDNNGGKKNALEEKSEVVSEDMKRMANTENEKPKGYMSDNEGGKVVVSDLSSNGQEETIELKNAPAPITVGDEVVMNEKEADKNFSKDQSRKEDNAPQKNTETTNPKKGGKLKEENKKKSKSNINKSYEQEKAPSNSAPTDDYDGVVTKQLSDSVKGGSFGGYTDVLNNTETTINQPVVTDSKTVPTSTTTVGNTNTSGNNSTVSANLGQAFVKFNQQKYADAAELYKKVLSAEPANYEAVFYLEQCYYHLKQYADLSVCANKIIADGKSVYVEGAKYYLAMSLIAQGKNEEAKKYLQQVQQKNASYKTEADVQLEKMK